MKRTGSTVLSTLPAATMLSAEEPQPVATPPAEESPWTFDLSLYGLAAGMSGDVVVKGIPADLGQWVVEPTVSYRVCANTEVLAGARYDNVRGEIRGPSGRNPTGTQDWWDPILGVYLTPPPSYRWVYNEYETGSGFNPFRYDLLTQGPQIGFGFHCDGMTSR